MYLPGEIAQQDATMDYLKKAGELDEQAAELAAHGKLREAVLMRNAAEEAEQMQAEAEAREKERLDYVQGQISSHEEQAEELANAEDRPRSLLGEQGRRREGRCDGRDVLRWASATRARRRCS
jgi:hypothetical protein